jgi:cytochrome P450
MIIGIGAGAAAIAACFRNARYIPPFGRLPYRGEPPMVFGSLLSGVYKDLNENQYVFLKACQAKYGNMFTLRVPNSDAQSVLDCDFKLGNILGCAKQFFKVMWYGFRYQTMILDPYAAVPLFASSSADRIPASRQALGRFGMDNLLSTKEGVKSLGHHLFSHQGSKDLLVATNHTSRTVAQQVFVGEVGLLAATYEFVLPVALDTFFGSGFATEHVMNLFRRFEPLVPFRSNGLEAKLLADKEQAVAEFVRVFESNAKPDESAIISNLAEIQDKFGIPLLEIAQMKLLIAWATNANLQHVIFWTLAHLAKDAAVRAELDREVMTSLNNPDWRQDLQDGRLDLEKKDLDAMVGLTSIMREAMRLYSKPNILRNMARNAVVQVAQLDRHFASFRVREGDWVSTFPQIYQHDSRFYEHPEEFRSSRFTTLDKDGKRVATTGIKHLKDGETVISRRTSAQGISASDAAVGGGIDSTGVGSFRDVKKTLTNFTYPFGMGDGHCPASKIAMDIGKIMILHVVAAVDLDLKSPLPLPELGGVHVVPPPLTDVRCMAQQPVCTRAARAGGA